MFLTHAELEEIVSDVVKQLEGNFSGDWLRYPCINPQPDPGTDPFYPETYSPQTSPHRCRLFEFFMALEGTVYLQLEHQLLRLQPGQLCLIPPGCLHVELADRVNTGASAFFVFKDDGVWINHSTTDTSGSFNIRYGQCIKIDQVLSSLMLKDICKELQAPQHGSQTMLKCSVLQQLTTILRELKKPEHRMTAEEWKESVVRDVIIYLNSTAGSAPDLNELADRCAMSANHLSSIFKAVTGMTISAYCGQLRIRQAKHLLETTPLKLRQLAEQLGYYDQYHFCKAFKKATGMSPSQYRKEKNDQ